MSDAYDSGSSCGTCLRSSPLASLLGLVFVLIGGGTVLGSVIYGWSGLLDFTEADIHCPYRQYIFFGLMGATFLFAILAYILCAFSTGHNSKHYFESSRRATCGRCCNMFLLLCLFLALLVWICLACLVGYSVISSSLLLYRDSALSSSSSGARNRRTIDNNSGFNPGSCSSDQLDLSYYGLYAKGGNPVCVVSEKLYERMKVFFICSCVALLGIFLILIGYIQIAICTAMNFSRMQELRYFEIVDPVSE